MQAAMNEMVSESRLGSAATAIHPEVNFQPVSNFDKVKDYQEKGESSDKKAMLSESVSEGIDITPVP